MEQRSIVRRARETILPYLLRREFRYEMGLMALSCLLGSVVIAGRIAPLAPAVVAAAWLAKRNPYYALFGATLGAAFAGRVDSAISPFVYMLLCLLWRAWKGELKKTQKFLMLPVSQFLMLPFFYMSSVENCVIGLLQAALCVIFAAVLQHGFLVLRQLRLRQILSEEEQVGLLLLSGLVVLALAGINPFGLSTGTAAAVFICLLFALARGASATAAAVLLGAALVLAGGFDVLLIGNLAACTLAAVILRPLGKYGVTAGFLVVALMIRAYVGEKYALALLETLLGAGAFVVIPRRFLQPICALVDADARREKREQRAAERLRQHTGRRLSQTADVFYQVADLFARKNHMEMPGRERQAVAAGAAMCVCADCSRMEKCWQDASLASEALLKYMANGGKQLPLPLNDQCLRKASLSRTVNAALEQYRLREAEQKKAENCLAFTHRQLSGVCSVMQTLSEEVKNDAWYDEELEARLRIRLDRERIRVRELEALREGKKLTIRLTLLDSSDAAAAANCVSKALHRQQRIIKSADSATITLSARPAYDATLGFSGCPAPESSVSGDSMGVRELGDGKLLVLLSDGMGTGEDAHCESSAAVALLGDLLSVGFDSDLALESVNRLLIARGAQDMYATLDAMLLDMNTGVARFIKFGAPPSYILREGKVHPLYCEALPAGIIEEAEAAVQQVRLKRGDAVIMMTDGVMDALGNGLLAALVERVGAANTVQDASDALVGAAVEEGACDDLSTIVIRI